LLTFLFQPEFAVLEPLILILIGALTLLIWILAIVLPGAGGSES